MILLRGRRFSLLLTWAPLRWAWNRTGVFATTRIFVLRPFHLQIYGCAPKED